MVDAIFSSRVLVYFLKQAGQIQMESGGHKIVQPLMYAKNNTAGSYSGSDVLSTAAQAGITAAEYEWKQYAASVVIEGLEEAKNNGEEQVINLLDSKITQTTETILENMDEMFLDDGTGNGGKDWNGLKNLAATANNTVGGIDASTNTWWNPSVDTSTTSPSIKNLGRKYNSLTVGNDKPNVLLTTQDIYESYEGLIQANQRFQDSRAADAGFENLMFKAAPILYDAYVDGTGTGAGSTGNYFYYLNTKYIRLVGLTGKWFYATPFKQPENQDIRVAQILCYGNLIASNRKRLGAFTNLTAV